MIICIRICAKILPIDAIQEEDCYIIILYFERISYLYLLLLNQSLLLTEDN